MISISSSSLLMGDFYQKSLALPDEKNKQNSARSQEQGISVNLSTDSRNKFAQELNDKFNPKQTEKKSDKDPIDALMDQLKEQIKVLKDKLRDLKYDSSEAAKTNRKMLNAQLISLHSLLLSMMGKKIESVKG